MTARNYSELVAWQKATDLVAGIYAATKQFPKEELYGLTSQVRRAAVSIPSNIAEGQGRKSANEFLHHLSIAYGSLREVETQVLIAGRLLYLRQEEINHLLEASAEVGRLINGLYKAVGCRQRAVKT